MEDIDGGLHPAADGQSLGERWNRKATDRRQWKTLMEGYILQWMDKAEMMRWWSDILCFFNFFFLKFLTSKAKYGMSNMLSETIRDRYLSLKTERPTYCLLDIIVCCFLDCSYHDLLQLRHFHSLSPGSCTSSHQQLWSFPGILLGDWPHWVICCLCQHFHQLGELPWIFQYISKMVEFSKKKLNLIKIMLVKALWEAL